MEIPPMAEEDDRAVDCILRQWRLDADGRSGLATQCRSRRVDRIQAWRTPDGFGGCSSRSREAFGRTRKADRRAGNRTPPLGIAGVDLAGEGRCIRSYTLHGEPGQLLSGAAAGACRAMASSKREPD